MDTARHFLVIHNDYLATYIGLFNGEQCIDHVSCDNKGASKMLFQLIDDLLRRNNSMLEKLLFIGVNQGPGPFTTLRVSIAAANGLAFATKLPLVGINSIETFVKEYNDQKNAYTIALLNAFCGDIYYAIINTQGSSLTSGCTKITDLAGLLHNLPNHPSTHCQFTFIGNYAEKGRESLGCIGEHIHIPIPCPTTASLNAMGKQAYQQWHTRTHVVNQLLPLYLKSSAPEMI